MSDVNYFAYGSNIHLPVLRHYLRQHGCDPSGISNPRRAFLEGYRFRTNYLTCSLWGAANIEPDAHARVEGILMQVTPEVVECLRRKEGCPVRYDETTVAVRLPRSCHCIVAVTYRVTDEYSLPTDTLVHPTYRATILEGAQHWGFGRDYQKRLRRVLRTASEINAAGEWFYGRERASRGY